MNFKFKSHNYVEHNDWLGVAEVDFHGKTSKLPDAIHDNMEKIREQTMAALAAAQREGVRFLLFTHGRSVSGVGHVSARSAVRAVMRSKAATPFIVRARCIQHASVYVAAIRPAPPLPVTSMVVDVYDSSARAEWCLLVPTGAATRSFVQDLRTGVSTMEPLSLRASGIALGALVGAEQASVLACSIGRQGGALMRKKELIVAVPDFQPVAGVTGARPEWHRQSVIDRSKL